MDRGTVAGVMRGMPVVTPDGIVGKVVAAYPTASEVLLITDADFAAGVALQRTQFRATLKGEGTPLCMVDYVPPEEKVQPGDWFYTSGDDRVFPRGFPVGVVKSVKPAQPFQEILVEPSGLRHGLEDVMILIQPAHQDIPDTPPVHQPVYIGPGTGSETTEGQPAAPSGGTEADKLRAIYKAAGDAQGHNFGEGAPGSKPPDFTKLPALGPGGQPVVPDKGAGGRGPGAGVQGVTGATGLPARTEPAGAPRAAAGRTGFTGARAATGGTVDAVRKANQAAGATGGTGRR